MSFKVNLSNFDSTKILLLRFVNSIRYRSPVDSGYMSLGLPSANGLTFSLVVNKSTRLLPHLETEKLHGKDKNILFILDNFQT